MRLLLTSILIFVCLQVEAQFKGLIINEFSQGNTGSREYIELLVVGKRTCNDSTADIRGWIIDDQNGWYGNTNGANGHYRFKDIPLWATVPYGSIILLYNSASGQKNVSITAADDPTDADKDYAYILPINSNNYLEEHDNEPTNISSPTYVYPPATSTIGYNGTSNTWVAHIALNNTGGDVLAVVSRNKRDSAFFSIGYGYTISTGYRSPSVAIADVAAGNSVGLIDSNYMVASKWTMAPVPLFETPGAPNGSVNTNWIQAMRMQPVPLVTYTTACSNGTYLFFGQTITSTGYYTALINNSNTRCVDTNYLYVVVKRNDVADTTACDSLIYRGIKYTNNATIVDNIQSTLINCDSIVRTLRIKIVKSSSSITNACLGAAQSYNFNGNTYTTSGNYAALLTNAAGCDSIARLRLTITVTTTTTMSGCGSVTYKGTIYTASTIVYDTVKNLTGCDSVIRRTNIQINSIKSLSINACLNEGDVYNFNGQAITITGSYMANLQTASGCDSIVRIYILFKKINTQTFSGCDSLLINGTMFYQSINVIDTVKSLVTNCDSIITIRNININSSKKIYNSVCTAANSYVFFGRTITASGFYTQLLSTASGCDSLVQLYLVLTRTRTQTISGCGTATFNGIIYTASTTTLRDTARSLVTGCDSLINIVTIEVSNTIDLQVSNPATICKGDSITLFAASTASTITWAGIGLTDSITVAPASTTVYTVTASNGGNCSNTKTVIVSVEDFSLNILASANPVLPAANTFLYTNANAAYSIFQWSPSTLFLNQSSKTQQVIIESSVNLFAVAKSFTGCTDTAYLTLLVTPIDDIYIPSGFTPNGDGRNDVVRVIGHGIKEFDFKIFNRWGHLLFATNDKYKGWDGGLAGKLQPSGTYVYVVKVKTNNGLLKEKKGTVTLIR